MSTKSSHRGTKFTLFLLHKIDIPIGMNQNRWNSFSLEVITNNNRKCRLIDNTHTHTHRERERERESTIFKQKSFLTESKIENTKTSS